MAGQEMFQASSGHSGMHTAVTPAVQSCCLLDAPCNEKLRVEELTGNPQIRSRLYSLGILPGTEIEVCRNGEKGCVCIKVRQSCLLLSEDMAESVFCLTDDAYQHRRRERHRRHECCRMGHDDMHCHGQHREYNKT